MKRFMSYLAALTLLAFTANASDFNVTFNLPTTNTNSTPLVDLDTIRFYKSDTETNFVKGVASPNYVDAVPAVSSAPVGVVQQAATITINGPFNDSVIWIRVTAVDDDANESVLSNAISVSVDDIPPDAPVLLSVEIVKNESGQDVMRINVEYGKVGDTVEVSRNQQSWEVWATAASNFPGYRRNT